MGDAWISRPKLFTKAAVVSIAALSLVWGYDDHLTSRAPRSALAQEAAIDPKEVSPTVTDVGAGFSLNADPDKTTYREREGGILVYEANFLRDQTPENLSSGAIDVKSVVARATTVQQASEQLSVSRRALLDAGWAENQVSAMGDESAGLSLRGSSVHGPAVAHVFVLRKGVMVAGLVVSGLEQATRMADAEALAGVVYRRIEASMSRQAATAPPSAAPAPAPSPSPQGASSGASGRVGNTEGAGLNLREAPSATAPVTATLPEGTVVEVLGPDRQAEGRSWKNVRSPDAGSGWVAAEYVLP